MAIVNYSSIAGRADRGWDLIEDWTEVSNSTTQVDYILDDGSMIRLDGSFILDSGKVAGGTINSLTYFTDNSFTDTFVTITGLSANFKNLPGKGRVRELFLAGDDTIEFRDDGMDINGFGGTDTITGVSQNARSVTLEATGGDTTYTTPVIASLNDTIDYRYNTDGTTNTRGVLVELKSNSIVGNTGLSISQEHLYSGRAFESRTENFASRASTAEFSDLFQSINHVKTGAGNDFVRGTIWYADADTVGGSTIRTGAGDDKIYLAYQAYGSSGDDEIYLSQAGRFDSALGVTLGGMADGGAGNDTLFMAFNPNSGTRVYDFEGGTGIDTAVLDDAFVSYASHDLGGDSEIYASGTVALYNHSRIDNLTDGDNDSDIAGNVFANELRGEGGADYIVGLGGNDLLDGGDGGDTLKGQGGSDKLFGQRGVDDLSGGAENDILKGGGGGDTLDGGAGNDRLFGGSGKDTFVFQGEFGRDRIKDFAATVNREKIDLSGVKAIADMNDLRKNHLVDQGNDVLIDAGDGHRIILLGVDIADLGRADFIF